MGQFCSDKANIILTSGKPVGRKKMYVYLTDTTDTGNMFNPHLLETTGDTLEGYVCFWGYGYMFTSPLQTKANKHTL